VSTQLQTQLKVPLQQSFTAEPTGLLQRKCACGQHTVAGGECAECRQKREGMIQRAAVSAAPTNGVPPIVHDVLSSSGQQLDARTRAFMEPRFCHDFSQIQVHTKLPEIAHTKLTINQPGDQYEQEADRVADAVIGLQQAHESTVNSEQPSFRHDFSQVRVHTDLQAAESAQAINALAYTVGRHIIFGSGQHAPGTNEGRRLLAHELTHVVQQEAKPGLQRIYRQPDKKKTSTKKPEQTFKFGQLHLAKGVLKDIGESLLIEDKAFIKYHGDSLGYDPNYKKPFDPFRWDKLKDIIDSNEKIQVDKKSLTDRIPMLEITTQGPKETTFSLVDPERGLAVEGITLITESLYKSIYPHDTEFISVSREKDIHHIYYSGDVSTKSADNPLAHELLGHLWLALKHVPFLHPKKDKNIKAMGTLREEHNISDPLGQRYTGTVETFIDKYINPKMQGTAGSSSPTLHVSREMLQSALEDFKRVFLKNARGKLNGDWHYEPVIEKPWREIGNNYNLAPKADSGKGVITQLNIQQNLDEWYKTLDVDHQFVFLKFLEKIIQQLDVSGDLASQLNSILVRPKGMHESEWQIPYGSP
jgi:hypothetical protein